MNTTTTLERGRRLHCILYGGKDGVVLAFVPSPEPIRSLLGGAMVAGGGEVRILWDNLTTSLVPEAVVRGVQWRILPEVLAPEEVDALEAAAQSAEADRKRQLAEDGKRYQAEQANGKARFEAAQPRWAQAVIVAHQAVDKSDLQTDYFEIAAGAYHILAWSAHTKDRFDEMRKAALRMPETAHLGPGCDRYTVRVVLERDVVDNGRFYGTGMPSPWHRDLYGDHYTGIPYTTQAAVDAFLGTAPAPEPVQVGDTLVTFRWEVVKDRIEPREKYSLGAGYYLHSGGSGGWTIEKVPIQAGRMAGVYAAFANGQVHLAVASPEPRGTALIQQEIARLKAENARLRKQHRI